VSCRKWLEWVYGHRSITYVIAPRRPVIIVRRACAVKPRERERESERERERERERDRERQRERERDRERERERERETERERERESEREREREEGPGFKSQRVHFGVVGQHGVGVRLFTWSAAHVYSVKAARGR
jgi:hypothetical protein